MLPKAVVAINNHANHSSKLCAGNSVPNEHSSPRYNPEREAVRYRPRRPNAKILRSRVGYVSSGLSRTDVDCMGIISMCITKNRTTRERRIMPPKATQGVVMCAGRAPLFSVSTIHNAVIGRAQRMPLSFDHTEKRSRSDEKVKRTIPRRAAEEDKTA
jgi:hypothetical protein